MPCCGFFGSMLFRAHLKPLLAEFMHSILLCVRVIESVWCFSLRFASLRCVCLIKILFSYVQIEQWTQRHSNVLPVRECEWTRIIEFQTKAKQSQKPKTSCKSAGSIKRERENEMMYPAFSFPFVNFCVAEAKISKETENNNEITVWKWSDVVALLKHSSANSWLF